LIDVAGPSDPDSLAFLFDLDGTLVDSVYQHVLAWREATQAAGLTRLAYPSPARHNRR